MQWPGQRGVSSQLANGISRCGIESYQLASNGLSIAGQWRKQPEEMQWLGC